jgi:hypothetical protein
MKHEHLYDYVCHGVRHSYVSDSSDKCSIFFFFRKLTIVCFEGGCVWKIGICGEGDNNNCSLREKYNILNLLKREST